MNNSAHDRPGVREQHLLRRKDNPLFDADRRDVSNELLARARLEDGVEMDRFVAEFQALVQKAVDLEPNAPSETILEIKEKLDRSYQMACALPGDQTQVKNAVRKLVAAIMQAIRAGIGNDAYAAQKLEDEEMARQIHFEMQELPLVCALTHPESPVAEDELIPSLLSEPCETLKPTLQMFDEQQLAELYRRATEFLQDRDPEHKLAGAWLGLQEIGDYYRGLKPGTPPN